jgi:aryl carrier-like protein
MMIVGLVSLALTQQSLTRPVFAIGGDSISAMELVAAARERGLQLSVPEVFKHPQITDLARVMHRSNGSNERIAPFSLLSASQLGSLTEEEIKNRVAAICGFSSPGCVEDVMPLTSLQAGLLAMTARRPGDYVGRGSRQAIEMRDWHFRIQTARLAFDLRQHVDVDRFRRACEEVVNRVAILRTRIVDLGSAGLVQVISDRPIQWHDAENLNDYLQSDEAEPMGLGSDLIRFALVQQTTSTPIFVLTIHHAL